MEIKDRAGKLIHKSDNSSTTVLLNNSAAPGTTDGAARELLEEIPGELNSDGCDGVGIMTFGACAASRGV